LDSALASRSTGALHWFRYALFVVPAQGPSR
jgi:hypothetical protein